MVLDSLISVFLVIALGWFLRRSLLPEEGGWKALEVISYYLLVPILIARTLAHAKLSEVPVAHLASVLVGTVLLLALALVLARPLIEKLLRTDPPGFTSIFQGTLRWNSFIALAIAGNLFGKEGVTLAAVAIASLIPVLNILCVSVLKKYGTGEGSLLRGLVTNPFILGTLLGILLNIVQPPIPKAIDLAFDIMGQCALGTGLLLVGAGLRLEDIHRPGPALLAGVFLRLLVTPLVGYALARTTGLTGNAVIIAMICLGVPTASAAWLLARKMGGDAPLMAAIITGQTLLSMLTLPILIALVT